MLDKIHQRSLLVLFFILATGNLCFAQASVSQMEKTSEDIKKEEVLRTRLEEKKVFIKEIVVQGASLLDEKETRKIAGPFLKRWLSQGKIEKIIRLLKAAYKKKGYANQPAHISSQVTDNCLEIRVKEN